jgi:4-amino-4-deoxy-L-arabinose transferase-like glycosyltransferase
MVAKTKRLDYSLILGLILGLAWLTKSPAIYFIVLFLITYFSINFKKIKLYDIYLIAVPLIISFVIYNILRLGPQFHMIALRNKDYVHPLFEVLKHPLDPLKPHLLDYIHLIFFYISLPVLFALFAKNKYLLILCCWAFLPVISNSAMAKVFTARYILYCIPSLLIIISLGLDNLLKKYKYSFLLFLFFIPSIILIFNLYTKPQQVKLPAIDMGYLIDWTSGWGIKEASIYLKNRSKKVNVIVGTEGYFGTLPDGLQIYTQSTNQLTVFGVGVNIEKIPEKLIDAQNYGDEVYILFNQSRLKISKTELDKLTLISKYPKPNDDFLVLYKL